MPKVIIATLLSIYILLILFQLTSPVSCTAGIIVIIVLLIISSSYIEFRLKHRSCSYLCYLNDSSKIFSLLSSPYLVVFLLVLYSIGLTISIFLETLFFSNIMWIYLGVHIVLMTTIFYKLREILSQSVKLNMLNLVTREFSTTIGAIILFLISIVLFYYSDTPSYIDSTLPKTIENATNSVGSSCVVFDYLSRLKAELTALTYWIISNSTEHLENENNRIFLWIVYILINAFSAIGINRLIMQVIYLSEKYLGKTK